MNHAPSVTFQASLKGFCEICRSTTRDIISWILLYLEGHSNIPEGKYDEVATRLTVKV